MYKIRLHARGGQGGKTAIRILAKAFYLEGMNVQAFSLYGAERRSAPVVSFLRVSEEKILERDYIDNPDCIIVLDDSLLKSKEELGLYKGLDPKEFLIINTKEKIRKHPNVNLIRIDATKIAEKSMHRPVFNVAMLGAYAASTKMIGMKTLEQAIHDVLKEKYPKWIAPNIKAMHDVYNAVEEKYQGVYE